MTTRLGVSRSIVVQQDYGWGEGPWLHITMEWLSDNFELLDHMPYGSHVFLMRAPIPESKLIDTQALGPQEHLALMARAIERADGEPSTMLELARVSLISVTDGHPAALNELDRIERSSVMTPAVQLCLDRVRGRYGSG